MATKKEQIKRILEENFESILENKNSVLNLEKTLSTKELPISRYKIIEFMKAKGYKHNKDTNSWDKDASTVNIPSNNEDIKSKEKFPTSITNPCLPSNDSLNISLTDDLRNHLKNGAKKKNSSKSVNTTSNLEHKPNESIKEIIATNIKEKSAIPEDNIINEMRKIIDNTASNCELILDSITKLSEQLDTTNSLLPKVTEDNISIPATKLLDILSSKPKKYDTTLPITLFELCIDKYCLRNPDKQEDIRNSKTSNIIKKLLIDYFVS